VSGSEVVRFVHPLLVISAARKYVLMIDNREWEGKKQQNDACGADAGGRQSVVLMPISECQSK
jgi:hypothetical protein